MSFQRTWWGKGKDLFEIQSVSKEEAFGKGSVPDTRRVVPGHEFMPEDLHQGILYRDEYDVFTKYLEDTSRKVEFGTTILCGHPGIGKLSYQTRQIHAHTHTSGKSACLYVLLAYRLRNRQVTAFQNSVGNAYISLNHGHLCSD